jgi:hypothetical protein
MRLLLLGALICVGTALPHPANTLGDDVAAPLVLRERGGGGWKLPDFRSLILQKKPDPAQAFFTEEDRAGGVLRDPPPRT